MITPEGLISDPMYQLNLALWMLQPLRDNYPLRPLLRENGFELEGIGQRLPIAAQTLVARLKAAKVRYGAGKEIDVLASRSKRTEFLLLECKRSMSWVSHSHDEQTTQARSFMLQAGEQLNDAIGLPFQLQASSWLVYLSVFDAGAVQSVSGLLDLARDLASKGFDVARAGLVGLFVRTESDGSKAICVRCLYQAGGSLTSNTDRGDEHEICIQKIYPDEDPRPLYYVPYDPEAFDGSEKTDSYAKENHDYCQRVFRDRLLQRLVCDIGSMTVPGVIVLDSVDYLQEALMGVYAKCERGKLAKNLRRQFKAMIKEALAGAKDSCKVEAVISPPSQLKVSIPSEPDKEKVLDIVSRISDGAAGMKSPEELETLEPTDLFSYIADQAGEEQP